MLKKFLLIFLAIFSLSYAKGELVKEIYLAGGCFWGMEWNLPFQRRFPCW